MSYTSLNYALLVGAAMLLYFCFPVKRLRWTVLLAASCFFYLLTGYRYAVYLLFTIVSTFFAAQWMDRISRQAAAEETADKAAWSREEKKAFKEGVKKRKRRILTLTLLLNFGILGVLKYYNLFAGSLNTLLTAAGRDDSVPTLHLLLPLGISFYTFQSMGYLIDVYRQRVPAEKNLGKFALFVSFFPQIVQGPISIYDQLAHQLYESHDFDFTRFKHACELILWGMFKKLVIADRAVIAISAVTGDYTAYNGTTLTFILLLYALQLYADFSGGIDITRGVAQIFGISMIDNFRQPYFATSISDYWHRWHISLGEWFRNYLFYPLAMSRAFLSAGRKIKSSPIGRTRAGAHIAKVLPTSIASFVVFLLVGVWHGPNWKYVAFGIWNGGIILLSSLLKPLYAKVLETLRIQPKRFLFRLFQMGRTFLIVLVGYVFDIAPNLTQSLQTFSRILTDQSVSVGWDQIRSLGLTKAHYGLMLLGGFIMLIVGVIHERTTNGSIREMLDRKPFLVRYGVILACILAVLYYGVWGAGYSPADFVYMQF